MTQPPPPVQPIQPPPPVQDPPAAPPDMPPTGPGVDEPATEIEQEWAEDENPEAHESPV